jgi:hypothetical protein
MEHFYWMFIGSPEVHVSRTGPVFFSLSNSYSESPFIYLSIFAVLGFERKVSTSPIFVMGFFKIGSPELFAWAAFEQ